MNSAQSSFDFGEPSSGPVNLLPRDGIAVLYEGAVAEGRAVDLFRVLSAELAWTQQQVFVFGRWVEQPRLTAWYGDEGCRYRYSGIELHPHKWTTPLIEIRQVCENLTGARFNSVLANLYRNGADSVSWHSDDEIELGFNPVIASVSLGSDRRFDLRHRTTGETVRLSLPAGSVLVMASATQHYWMHQVPKTARDIGPRINLTFRLIHG